MDTRNRREENGVAADQDIPVEHEMCKYETAVVGRKGFVVGHHKADNGDSPVEGPGIQAVVDDTDHPFDAEDQVAENGDCDCPELAPLSVATRDDPYSIYLQHLKQTIWRDSWATGRRNRERNRLQTCGSINEKNLFCNVGEANRELQQKNLVSKLPRH